MLRAASRLNHDFALFPIGPIEAQTSHHALINEAIQRSHIYDVNAPSLRLWHQFALAHHVGKGPLCGFPIFELDDFTAQEKHHLRSMDFLFAASEWGCKVLSDHGMKNVHKLPLGVDGEIFAPRPTENLKKTIFLNVGKLEIRKGHSELIDAFNMAFSPNDDVLLLMACGNPFLSPEDTASWINLSEQTPMGGQIKIITDRSESQESIANLMSVAHCGVFPTKAEGFCLPILEMMSMGKHIIATDYSGHTEFVNKHNSFLINIDRKETAYDGRWFHGTGKWAHLGEGQIEQLVNHMRAIHKSHQAGEELYNQEGIKTVQSYTWENSISSLEEALSC